MEPQFTPGPWEALCLKKYTRVMRRRQGRGDETGSVQIAHIAGPDDMDLRPTSGDMWEANARLIAAAPDLYVAVLDLVGHARWVAAEFNINYAHLDNALAALAKATGEA